MNIKNKAMLTLKGRITKNSLRRILNQQKESSPSMANKIVLGLMYMYWYDFFFLFFFEMRMMSLHPNQPMILWVCHQILVQWPLHVPMVTGVTLPLHLCNQTGRQDHPHQTQRTHQSLQVGKLQGYLIWSGMIRSDLVVWTIHTGLREPTRVSR